MLFCNPNHCESRGHFRFALPLPRPRPQDFQRLSGVQRPSHCGSKMHKPAQNKLKWFDFTNFSLPASTDSDNFLFRSLHVLHICQCSHKYDKSVSRWFWVYFLAGFCHLVLSYSCIWSLAVRVFDGLHRFLSPCRITVAIECLVEVAIFRKGERKAHVFVRKFGPRYVLKLIANKKSKPIIDCTQNCWFFNMNNFWSWGIWDQTRLEAFV